MHFNNEHECISNVERQTGTAGTAGTAGTVATGKSSLANGHVTGATIAAITTDFVSLTDAENAENAENPEDTVNTVNTGIAAATDAAANAGASTISATSTGTTGSCTLSTDSGVIIIDNTPTNNAANNNNNSNNSNNNNSNNSNSNNNCNINEKLNNENYYNCKSNKSNANSASKNVSIENIINISKTATAAATPTSAAATQPSHHNNININNKNTNNNINNNSNNNSNSERRDFDILTKTTTTTTTTPITPITNNQKQQHYNEQYHGKQQQQQQHQQQQQWQNNFNQKSSKAKEPGTGTGTGTGTGIRSAKITASATATLKDCSPTVSIRSTSISIVSINESAEDSSIVDSDSENEADAEGVHANYTVKKLGQQTTYPPNSSNLSNLNKGLTVIGQRVNPVAGYSPNGNVGNGRGGGGGAADGGIICTVAENMLNGGLCPPAGPALQPSTPQIGSIALTNSTDVTFGDKHFYEGPVTIQQFLIDSRDKAKGSDNDGGHDNSSFAHDPHNPTKANNQDGGQKVNTPLTDPPFRFLNNRKAVIITGSIILLTIIVGVVFATTNSLYRTPSRKNPDDDYEDNNLRVVRKVGWLGRPPKADLTNLTLPVHRVIISHTASETCDSLVVCGRRIRDIQNYHMDSMSWDDIGYNFLIGGDGRVYVGRGWDRQGAHTKGYNVDSLGISFVGTFTVVKPPARQLLAAQLLIEEGVRQFKISPDYRIYGARQFSSTESPGLALYEIIQTWSHWTNQL